MYPTSAGPQQCPPSLRRTACGRPRCSARRGICGAGRGARPGPCESGASLDARICDAAACRAGRAFKPGMRESLAIDPGGWRVRRTDYEFLIPPEPRGLLQRDYRNPGFTPQAVTSLARCDFLNVQNRRIQAASARRPARSCGRSR